MLSHFGLSDSMDCNLPGSSVQGILQARIREWIAMPSSRDLPDPGIKLASPALAGRLYPWATWKPTPGSMCVSVVQSCSTLCNSLHCSFPGSSVQGILQARILEWVASPFSRGSSQPRDQTQVSPIAGRFFTIWATGNTFKSFFIVRSLIY